MRRTVILLLLPAMALLTACGSSSDVASETIAQQTSLAGADLIGKVGPGFEIILKQDGSAVAALKAGSYTLAVVDAAATHDFALQAPDGTITQITDVPFTGTKTATVTLTPGVWTYLCQPHATQMHGSFTVS